MPTEPDRPYDKWLTILTRLEREINKTFPPTEVKGKMVEDPRRRSFRREFSALRGTLRNFKKLDKVE